MLPKSSWATFKRNFEALSALGVYHVTIIGGVVYKKSKIFIIYKCHQNPPYDNFRNSISSGGLSRDHYWRSSLQDVYKFLEHISASFWYFIVKSFFVVRSYRVLVIKIKILIIGALGTLETRLKVPILAIFWRFWAFFELSV